MSVSANFADIYAWQKNAMRSGIDAKNPANWLVNSKRTRQSGFYSLSLRSAEYSENISHVNTRDDGEGAD